MGCVLLAACRSITLPFPVAILCSKPPRGNRGTDCVIQWEPVHACTHALACYGSCVLETTHDGAFHYATSRMDTRGHCISSESDESVHTESAGAALHTVSMLNLLGVVDERHLSGLNSKHRSDPGSGDSDGRRALRRRVRRVRLHPGFRLYLVDADPQSTLAYGWLHQLPASVLRRLRIIDCALAPLPEHIIRRTTMAAGVDRPLSPFFPSSLRQRANNKVGAGRSDASARSPQPSTPTIKGRARLKLGRPTNEDQSSSSPVESRLRTKCRLFFIHALSSSIDILLHTLAQLLPR